MSKEIFAVFIAKDFNNCVDKGVFPDGLKHAVTIVQKKKDKNYKTNYKPVSILTNISKLYEKLIYNRLYDYFDDIFLLVNVVFERGTVMLEKFKESVDKGNEFCPLLTALIINC